LRHGCILLRAKAPVQLDNREEIFGFSITPQITPGTPPGQEKNRERKKDGGMPPKRVEAGSTVQPLSGLSAQRTRLRALSTLV
jgi:hypothetical protein